MTQQEASEHYNIHVDVCISNEEDAKDVFGIEAEATDIYAGEINREGYKSVAKQLADKFHFEKVAITLRESHSAFDNGWSGAGFVSSPTSSANLNILLFLLSFTIVKPSG